MEIVSALTDENVDVLYDSEQKLIVVDWKVVNIPSEKYRNVYTYLLTEYEIGDILYLLVDTTKCGLVSPEDRAWFQEYAVTKAAENGLLKAAIVIKNNPFKKYYANAILKAVTRKTTFEMKVFTDLEKANVWILAN